MAVKGIGAVAVIAALVLSGCSDRERRADICSGLGPRFPNIPANVEDNVVDIKACTEHWAARLSFSAVDDATTVARVAVNQCAETIDSLAFQRWPDVSPVDRQALVEQWRQELYDTALFRAVQQRAGNCGLPPIGDLPTYAIPTPQPAPNEK